MDKEIELKLQVAPENIPVLRNHPHFANAFNDSVLETLNSGYFDCPDNFLREHGSLQIEFFEQNNSFRRESLDFPPFTEASIDPMLRTSNLFCR